MSNRRPPHLIQFSMVGLLLLAILIYFPRYHVAFVGDDYVQIDYILQLAQRPFTAFQVFDPFYLPWYYRPLQNLWFLGNFLSFGYQPFGYYWLGLLVHLLAVAVFYRVTRQFGLQPAVAVAAAALFAIFRHHMDVVAWISAIAIVLGGLFTLAANGAYLAYLRNQAHGGRYLALTLLFFLLAAISHEESILIPPLLLWWRLAAGPWRRVDWRARLRANLRAVSRAEWAVFGVMFAVTAAYVALQFLRPNLTISLADTPTTHWLNYLAPANWALFTADTLRRFLPFIDLRGGFLLSYPYVVTLAVAAGLGAWFWYGRRLTRYGLVWTLAHLALIYWALWSQKPTLYAGRHLYHAWIGLLLALAATAQQLLAQRPKQRNRATLQQLAGPALAAGALLYLLAAILTTQAMQARWLARTEEDMAARAQMRQLLPEVTNDTHVFAYRFPITPDFLRSVTQAWYDQGTQLLSPFGPLEELRQEGQADADFYVFDYEADGRLYNLMPELQQVTHTDLIWAQPPAIWQLGADDAPLAQLDEKVVQSVAGPEDDRRFALQVAVNELEGWKSYRYALAVPPGGMLETAVRQTGQEGQSAPGMTFRVRLQTGDEAHVLAEITIPPGDTSWHGIQAPLPAQDTVLLYLEVRGSGLAYWANPRITISHELP